MKRDAPLRGGLGRCACLRHFTRSLLRGGTEDEAGTAEEPVAVRLRWCVSRLFQMDEREACRFPRG